MLKSGLYFLKLREYNPLFHLFLELTVDRGLHIWASILWAEEGSNPRDIQKQTSRGYSVEGCQTVLREAHWKVAEGPPPAY